METMTYNSFGEKIEKCGTFEIGTIVWAYGPNSVSKWAVYDDKNNVVKLSENNEDDYFSAPFNRLGLYVQPIEKRFGIGLYYDLNVTKATQEEIDEAIEKGKIFVQRIENEKNEKARKRNEEVAKIEAKYDGVFEKTDKQFGIAAHVGRNVRKALKMAFPKDKFSVRKYFSDDVLIQWENGPTEDEVRDVVGMFEKNYHRDKWNDDLWDSENTPFTSVFGGVDRIRLERDFSNVVKQPIVDDILHLCPQLEEFECKEKAFKFDGFNKVYEKYIDGVTSFPDWCNAETIAKKYLAKQSLKKVR